MLQINILQSQILRVNLSLEKIIKRSLLQPLTKKTVVQIQIATANNDNFEQPVLWMTMKHYPIELIYSSANKHSICAWGQHRMSKYFNRLLFYFKSLVSSPRLTSLPNDFDSNPIMVWKFFANSTLLVNLQVKPEVNTAVLRQSISAYLRLYHNY